MARKQKSYLALLGVAITIGLLVASRVVFKSTQESKAVFAGNFKSSESDIVIASQRLAQEVEDNPATVKIDVVWTVKDSVVSRTQHLIYNRQIQRVDWLTKEGENPPTIYFLNVTPELLKKATSEVDSDGVWGLTKYGCPTSTANSKHEVSNPERWKAQ